MQRVFVLSADGQALDPCHPARARSLLRERRAAIARRYPFTIILKERMAVESVAHAHAVKIDPGSKTTGMAVVNNSGLVVWAAEIEHRGQQIRDRLLARRQQRHSRRSRKTRYRPARFDNCRRAKDWLPPSLVIPTCTRKSVNRCGMLPLLTQPAGRSINAFARQACPLNAIRADEQNSTTSPSACPKRIGWMLPAWASRAQTYKSPRPSPRLSSSPWNTVRARCPAWTDTVSLARGRKEHAGDTVSGRGIWCAPLGRAAKGPVRISDGSPCALPGVATLWFRTPEPFPLPAERCKGLTGDLAIVFTVPMAIPIHLNLKEAAFAPHCQSRRFPCRFIDELLLSS